MNLVYKIVLFFCLFTFSHADDNFSQWRGENRDGKYPDKNLLKKWPDKGPELLWQIDNIGEGHSSAAMANSLIFVTGTIKKEGVLHCFDMDGKLLWKSSYGAEWFKSYAGSRSTPTVIGNNLYLISGMGRIVCFDALTGKEQWSLDMLEKFNAENIEWGIAESPLVDGDLVICTPGGPSENIVALNRFNGKTVWTSEGNGDLSAYCSPLLVEHNGTRLIVTMTAKSILGIDTENGKVHWRIPQRQEFGIHADTPLYHDGKIFCISGSDNSSGAVVLELSADGKEVSELWRHTDADNLIGGVILHDGFIYGSRYEKDEWFCVDWNTGALQYISEEIGGGSIIFADGLFYCYGERGTLGLVDANADKFEVISSIKIKSGKGPHWAHPVIDKGRLYIRHGGSLLVFDISDRTR